MFNIETIEDVKILKALTRSSENDRIKELEQDLLDLRGVITKQNSVIKTQQGLIDELKEMKPLTKKDVELLISSAIKQKTSTGHTPRKRVKILRKDTDEFVIPPSYFKHKIVSKYNELIVQGNDILHKAKSGHVNTIPITTLQFLTIVEKFTKGKSKILEKDVDPLCNICEISRNQFSKIYYNLKEGVFFDVIESIDKQLKQASFFYQDGFIYIQMGNKKFNTKVDKNLYAYLLNVYVNSDTPYLTIYKLSKEKKDIEPIFLLSLLRKNEKVSQAIGGNK